MATPKKRPTLARIELLTLLLLGAIVVVVIIPKCRNTPSEGTKPAQNAPKQPVTNP
ncbi:MAG: hypothetical protein QM760_22745 [Nibricoccus sp.]